MWGRLLRLHPPSSASYCCGIWQVQKVWRQQGLRDSFAQVSKSGHPPDVGNAALTHARVTAENRDPHGLRSHGFPVHNKHQRDKKQGLPLSHLFIATYFMDDKIWDSGVPANKGSWDPLSLSPFFSPSFLLFICRMAIPRALWEAVMEYRQLSMFILQHVPFNGRCLVSNVFGSAVVLEYIWFHGQWLALSIFSSVVNVWPWLCLVQRSVFGLKYVWFNGPCWP